jgi:hypothetical protein
LLCLGLGLQLAQFVRDLLPQCSEPIPIFATRRRSRQRRPAFLVERLQSATCALIRTGVFSNLLQLRIDPGKIHRDFLGHLGRRAVRGAGWRSVRRCRRDGVCRSQRSGVSAGARLWRGVGGSWFSGVCSRESQAKDPEKAKDRKDVCCVPQLARFRRRCLY